MRHFNEALEKGNDFVSRQCKHEIEALEEAQKKLDDKLRTVMQSNDMKRYEEAIKKANRKAQQSMRRAQEELTTLHYSIEDDDKLSEDEKIRRLTALSDAAMNEYTEMAKEFPSAMRAQMLAQMSSVRLLM